MQDDPAQRFHADVSDSQRSWPMRWWLAAPDWAFRVLGASFFFGYLAIQLQKYWTTNFWELGPYYIHADGTAMRMPWVPVLVDLTFLLIALSFCIRLPPRTRAANGWVILFSLFTGFLPLLVVFYAALLGMIDPERQVAFLDFLWRSPITYYEVLIGGTLITIGNALDVWGYAVLCRSFSIVPEPRELKTTGPYRLVRHPVYLGQFLAQGGVWLFFASLHVVWIGLYILFVAMQLVRSKLEDRVLEEAFGDEYRHWKEKTFWFV